MMLTHAWLDQYRKIQPVLFRALENAVYESVQFDFGSADEIPRVKGKDYALCIPPYPNVVLQFEAPNSIYYSHAIILWQSKTDGNSVLICAQKTRSDGLWRTSLPCVVKRDGDGFIYEKIGFNEENNKVITCMHGMALNFFYVLGCANVSTVENKAPAFINKKRAKQGKMPILSYKTLVISVNEKNRAGGAGGGTHASPRVHLRRGHVRQLPSGYRIWVQPCVVGSPHGMVIKDYKVNTK